MWLIFLLHATHWNVKKQQAEVQVTDQLATYLASQLVISQHIKLVLQAFKNAFLIKTSCACAQTTLSCNAINKISQSYSHIKYHVMIMFQNKMVQISLMFWLILSMGVGHLHCMQMADCRMASSSYQPLPVARGYFNSPHSSQYHCKP